MGYVPPADENGSKELSTGGDGRFHILAVLEGEVRLSADPSGQPLGKGETARIPASLTESIEVADGSVLLDA